MSNITIASALNISGPTLIRSTFSVSGTSSFYNDVSAPIVSSTKIIPPTTANALAVESNIRYNSTSKSLELYNGTAWVGISSGSSGSAAGGEGTAIDVGGEINGDIITVNKMIPPMDALATATEANLRYTTGTTKMLQIYNGTGWVDIGSGNVIAGGNTGLGTLVLGTNDAQSLQLETSGTTKLFIGTSGDITGIARLTISGTSTFFGDLNAPLVGSTKFIPPTTANALSVESNIRYNSVSKTLELYNGSSWTSIGSGAGVPSVSGDGSSVMLIGGDILADVITTNKLMPPPESTADSIEGNLRYTTGSTKLVEFHNGSTWSRFGNLVSGGNTGLGTLLIGTNDSQSLELETSGITRLAIGSTGSITGLSTLNVSGPVTMESNLLVKQAMTTVSSLTVTGAQTNLSTLNVSGSTTLNTSLVLGNTTLQSTGSTQLSTNKRIYQNLYTGSSWEPSVNGHYALAKNSYPSLSRASGVKAVSTWTTRTSAADLGWASVCWSPELCLFVAVGYTGTGNRVMTSSDGITWTSRTSAADINWFSVTWAAELSLFVAVASSGTGNRVMTSSNGTTWTSRTSAADNNWWSVCWAPELSLLVAVADSGTGNRVMTSPDGINWTTRTSAADNSWRSVCWSPELSLFVAVAATGSGNRVMTSPNGINWTSRTSAVDNEWYSVCWSPQLGLFAAVSLTGTNNRVMTSPDGINWTARTSASNNNWHSVCWAPELELFVATSTTGTGNRVMTSPDGINWTSRTSAANNDWVSICWSPELGIFAAISNNGTGNRVMTSSLKGRPPTSYNLFDSSVMSVSETGNVGIGTTSPNSLLSLNSSTQNLTRLSLTGQEFWQASNTSTDGIAFLIGVNRSDNRQLWIGHTDKLAQNTTNNVIRIIPNNDGSSIDAIATDGTTTKSLVFNPNGGNVGIGTNSPSSTLHLFKGAGANQVGPQIRMMRAGDNYGASIWMGNSLSNGDYLAFGVANLADPFANEKMRINNSGSMGIGTTSPYNRLDVDFGGSRGLVSRNSVASDASASTDLNSLPNNTVLGPSINLGGSAFYLYGKDNSGNKKIANFGTSALFTGQHAGKCDTIDMSNINQFVGLIVVSKGKYYDKNPDGTIIEGKNAISIVEALPRLELSSKYKQKSVFGIVSNINNWNNGKRLDTDTDFDNGLGDKIRVNSLGEGAIWVVSEMVNGSAINPIENGDYITTSEIPGLGMVQDNEFLCNYTVAKATCDCTFELDTEDYNCIEFTYNDKIYRKAFIGCTYHCG